MGLTSIAGRFLFASFFILSAWREFNTFGVDGGPAAKALRPKFNSFTSRINFILGLHVPEIEIKHIIAALIALKGVGSILFVFGTCLGAYLLLLQLVFLTPILHDFYNYDFNKPEFIQLFVKFTESLALFGALLFFLGMKNSWPKQQSKKKVAPKTKIV